MCRTVVPDKLTTWGLELSESKIEIEPISGPKLLPVLKVTFTLHFASGGSEEGQLFV